jgi:hypothetical protein
MYIVDLGLTPYLPIGYYVRTRVVVGKCMLMYENVSLHMLFSLPLYFQAVFVLLPRIVYCVQILFKGTLQRKKRWAMSYFRQ